MKISTKFDVGSRAYVLQDARIVECKVVSVSANASEISGGIVTETYAVRVPEGVNNLGKTYRPDDLFESVKDLIESIHVTPYTEPNKDRSGRVKGAGS